MSSDTLPTRMVVKKQWSIIRATPNGDIITSLAKGTLVKINARTAGWFNISTLNDTAPHGYMHKSTIAHGGEQ